MHRLIRFKPVYQARVWGGRALAGKLGRRLPEDSPIGESWEIVDRPEAQSIDVDTGKTLRILLRQHPESIMGPGYEPERRFPILVKWLDCEQRLSLQVHPPKNIADQLGGEPKTECWYIADTSPEAALIVGLRNGVTRDQFEQAIEDENLEPLLHRFGVQPGQSILLQSGRLHAIDAGNLILEIQENSDTTYRVYDWGRKGLDGKPRQLHVEESLKSIDFNDFEPQPNVPDSRPGEILIAECPQFRIRQINLQSEESLELPQYAQPTLISVVRGTVTDGSNGAELAHGENILSPWSAKTVLKAKAGATMLVTDRFV